MAAATASSRPIRSSPNTVAIFKPVRPSVCAVSTAARAAAVGLMPPAFVMTFVRPAATAGSAAARYTGRSRVAARLVLLTVLLEDRQRELGERFEAEVVDAVGEQPFDGARRVAVEALPTTDPDHAWTGGRRSDHGRARSSWAATASSRSSRFDAATRCTPTGSPSGVQCNGSEIAG